MKLEVVLRLLLSFLFLLCFGACEEESIPDENNCYAGNEVIREVENGQGNIATDANTGVRILTYHIPGTIDSVLSGVLCDEGFPEFEVPSSQRVTFSGQFIDDEGQIEFTSMIGGQRYAYLNLTTIQVID